MNLVCHHNITLLRHLYSQGLLSVPLAAGHGTHTERNEQCNTMKKRQRKRLAKEKRIIKIKRKNKKKRNKCSYYRVVHKS